MTKRLVLKRNPREKEYSIEDDAKRVNPSFNNFDNNTKSNCMLCTTTYDLRRRGFDVTANKASVGYTTETINKWYPKAKIKTIKETYSEKEQKYLNKMKEKGREAEAEFYLSMAAKRKPETIESISKDLMSQGDGARGNLMVRWTLGGGHSVAYENSGRKTIVVDSQSNKTYTLDSFLKRTSGPVSFARLDNVDFDPSAIKEASRS